MARINVQSALRNSILNGAPKCPRCLEKPNRFSGAALSVRRKPGADRQLQLKSELQLWMMQNSNMLCSH
jgi:hypothetical protein